MATITQADPVSRALLYVEKMPPAFAGQGGHAATFKVAVVCAHGFGLKFDGIMAVLARYNERCEPPWSHAELSHKAHEALKAAPRRPVGYLLGVSPGGAQRLTSLQASRHASTGERTKQQRPWPALRRGTRAEIESLARLLGLPFDAVALAHDNGLVRFGTHRGWPAWFVTDSAREVCQARRVDGSPWQIGGSAVKPDTIVRAPGSGRHLVGLPLASGYRALLSVEGGSDLIAAFALILGDTIPGDDLSLCWDVCPVAMLGAGNRLIGTEAAQLAGKRVFICYDDDGGPPERNTGQREARKRAAELAAAGAIPYKVTLPGGCNDLRDVVKAGLAPELARAIHSALGLEGGAHR